ncbi:MAG: hypothetical protein KDC44_22515 [Phaeodactylibacter sp.]|nr:hypothetical protein [Phaeodactylibacter sp.]
MFHKMIAFACSLLLPLLAIAQMGGGTTVTELLQLDRDGYSVQYPSDWEADESGQMNTTFILLSAQEDASDMFQENVNLLLQNLAGMGIDLDKFVEVSLAQIKIMITDSEIIESSREEAHGRSYHKVIHRGKQSGFDLTFVQYYWIVNETAYVLTLTTESAKFDKFKQAGLQIMDSFVIKAE